MKKILLTSTILLLLITHASAFTGSGSGTSGDPYEISTCSELQEMQNDLSANYVLVNDVDCSGFSGFSSVGGYSNGFDGVLDGQGYEVQDLTINKGSEWYVGLIGGLGGSGEVKNIGVVKVDINGEDNVGGLIGYSRGSVSSSYTTGSVSGTDYVGGLVGDNDEYDGYVSEVTSSFSTATVSGSGNSVGGLVGGNYGNVYSSFATGSVHGEYSGGLVGRHKEGSISNGFSTGSVSGDYYVGGFVGFHDSSGSISDGYWDTQSSGTSTGIADGPGDVTGLTTSEMQDSAAETNMGGLDFPDTWLTVSNDYPKLNTFEGGDGSSGDPYQISTCQQLQEMQNDLSAHYELVNDVDCSSYSGFSSVGNGTNKFTGVLDGQGYEVQDLTINKGGGFVGLIGSLGSSGEVRDIGMVNVDIISDYMAGGLVGKNYGSVSSSFSTGSVDDGIYDVGGLLGLNDGSVSSSYWDNESSGQSSSAGGTGLTTSEMQGNACGMTEISESNWNFYSGEYPELEAFSTGGSRGNCPPSASFSSNSPVLTGEDFGLDASGSSDLDGDSLTYEWDTNNDGTYGDKTGVNPSVSKGDDGSYTIGLKVSDGNGGTDTASATVTVENRAPSASFSFSPSSPGIDESVSFDGSGSSDPDGALSYSWDLDGDGSYEKGVSKFSQGNGFSYNHVSGEYAEASDGNGQCSSPGGGIKIPVGNNPGQVTLDLEASTGNWGKAHVGIDHADGFDVKTITSSSGSGSSFSGTKTYDLSGYSGDISLIVGNHETGSNCGNADHMWDVKVNNIDDFELVESTTKQSYSLGSYSVVLRVTDDDGATSTTSKTINVSDGWVVSDISYNDSTVQEGESFEVETKITNNYLEESVSRVTLDIPGLSVNKVKTSADYSSKLQEQYSFTGSKVTKDISSFDSFGILEMNGAQGGQNSGATASGGLGGRVEGGTVDASGMDTLEIWVGESGGTSAGGWGKIDGGQGQGDGNEAGGGGGSTELWADGSTFIAAADAGGGASYTYRSFYYDVSLEGGGGARGGNGFESAAGDGFGGDGGDTGASYPGDPGGAELGAPVSGGSTSSGVSSGDGNITLEFPSLSSGESENFTFTVDTSKGDGGNYNVNLSTKDDFRVKSLTVESPPDSPDNPSPSDGAISVSKDPSLSVYVTDPAGDSMNVTFYNASDDSQIGFTQTGVSDGETASVKWSDLSSNTVYSWYAVADDGSRTTQSSTWSFTTTLLDSQSNPDAVNGALWVQGSDLSWGNGTHEFWLNDAKIANVGSSGPNGGLWVQGSTLRWIDENGDERDYKGSLLKTNVAGPEGGLWVQNDLIRYIDENGDERVIDGNSVVDFQLSGVVDDGPVTEGETFNVDYTVSNEGGISGVQDVVLEVNGVQEDADSGVSLSSGGSSTGTLEWVTEVGDSSSGIGYTVSTGNDSVSGSLDVNSLIGPSAIASKNVTEPKIGDVVKFVASGSTSGDGSITGYSWDVDGDGDYEYTNSGSNPNVTHTYSSSGSKNVILNVSDDNGLYSTDSLSVEVNSNKVVYDFESGGTSNWDSPLDLQVVSDRTFDGSDYSGYLYTSDNAPDPMASVVAFEQGEEISKMSMVWQETDYGNGHALRLLNSNGNLELAVASDNPQWELVDQNQNRIYSGDGYDRWIKFNATFDWPNSEYEYYIEDLDTGSTKTGTRSLKNGKNVRKVLLGDYGSSFGGTYDDGSVEVWYDNIELIP